MITNDETTIRRREALIALGAGVGVLTGIKGLRELTSAFTMSTSDVG